jgi:hypothetical protein
LTQVTADTVKQLDAVLESFTGSSLSDLIGRRLSKGPETEPRKDPDETV